MITISLRSTLMDVFRNHKNKFFSISAIKNYLVGMGRSEYLTTYRNIDFDATLNILANEGLIIKKITDKDNEYLYKISDTFEEVRDFLDLGLENLYIDNIRLDDHIRQLRYYTKRNYCFLRYIVETLNRCGFDINMKELYNELEELENKYIKNLNK